MRQGKRRDHAHDYHPHPTLRDDYYCASCGLRCPAHLIQYAVDHGATLTPAGRAALAARSER